MSPVGDGPAISWAWPQAALGLALAVPAAVTVLDDADRGLALAVGVLPAAAVGLPADRRARVAIAVLGSLAGVSLLVGAVLARWPAVAVVGVFALTVGASVLAARVPFGAALLFLCVPLVGVGLSYPDLGEAAGFAALVVAGSVYAWLVSLLWPARTAVARPLRTLGSRAAMLDYGVRVGGAAALAAAIGFGLGLEHVGWACAAVLLVCRPDPELLRARALGRVVSVVVGAVGASALVLADPTPAALSVATVLVLVLVAATRGSRWYVTSAFTTFLVFLVLLHAQPDEAGGRFVERVAETLLGVGLALAAGWLLPAVRSSPR